MKLSIVQSVRMLSVTKSPKSNIVLNVVMLSVVAKLSQLCSSMGNVRQVIIPIVAKCICENIFYLYVSFLTHFSIKIVSQKMVILSGLSQKLVTGFFPTLSFTTDAKLLLPATLPHSHTLFLCLSRCLPVSPSFRSNINITQVCILDY
jgi:hypothetical protein